MIRIGTVPYLNALPLIWTLDRSRIVAAPPSDLARLHHRDELDVSLLPVVEGFGRENLTFVPEVAVAARDRTDSVRLHLRRPIEEVQTVGLDRNSRTSNALLRVLFARKYKRHVTFVEHDPTARNNLDAALTIGDAAFSVPTESSLDLGCEWRALTGKPFVFAVWMHRIDHPKSGEIRRMLQEAKAAGVAQIEAIAAEEGPRRGLSVERARRYLTECIHYDLGPEELEGMELFRSWCRP